MPREPINIEFVSTQARFEEVRAFAASFDHIVEPHLALYAVKRGSKLIGYSQVIQQPIGVPNWHPAASSRDIMEGSAALRAWQQAINAAGEVTILVYNTEDRMSDETLAHLGFHPLNAKLYVSKQ